MTEQKITEAEMANAIKKLVEDNGYQIVNVVLSKNAHTSFCGPIGFESDPHGVLGEVN